MAQGNKMGIWERLADAVGSLAGAVAPDERLKPRHKRVLCYLDESRNPLAVRVVMWTGYAGPEWAWPNAHPTAISDLELLPQQRGGGVQYEERESFEERNAVHTFFVKVLGELAQVRADIPKTR